MIHIISATNMFYDNIIESMTYASDELVSRNGGRTKAYNYRPGWNSNARDLYTAARKLFVM